MRSKYYGLVVLMISSLLISACTSRDAPVTPAPDRPTFLYFYTEN